MTFEKGNTYGIGNKGGRPVKYKTVEEMQVVIDKYFSDVEKNNEKAIETGRGDKYLYESITGMAVALGLTRKGLIDYEHKDPEFRNAIKDAKTKIEACVEQRLFHNNATGSIFNLKNNFGWKDQTQQSVVSVNIDPTTMTEEELDSELKKYE